MKRKLTRRELLAASAASAASLSAQTASAQTTSAEDWARAARDANRNNADAIAKIALPMSIEPAFQFKA